MIKGEDIIRVEHKLDAILWYLRTMTGVPPVNMPKTIPGMSGMTDGKCPITDTPIYLTIDPATGKPSRRDGLSSGLVETTLFPEPPSFKSNSAVLGNSTMSSSGEDIE